jgi:acyl carrier protein
MSREVTGAEIRAWCIDHIAAMLERSAAEIDPTVKFARLGLDSATIINLIIAAEEWLGIEVDPDAVYEYPNVNALSDHLAALIERAGGRSAA